MIRSIFQRRLQLFIGIACIFLRNTKALPVNIYQGKYDVRAMPPPRVEKGDEINYPIVEDDIKLTNVDPYQSVQDVWLRSAVTDKAKIWTGGIVPFYVDETFFDKDELKKIEEAIDEFHTKTCIRFIPRTSQMPYLYITPLSRCWSEIGMPSKEGIRTLSLGPSCLERRGTVIHELMHVLGFWHEQNRVDRDDYVTINWENIREGLQHNFIKYNEDKVDTLQEPYDYQSIMHYSSYAFTKDPDKLTIVPKIPVTIGQRFGLSPLDVKKIEKLYGCTTNSPTIHFQHGKWNPAQDGGYSVAAEETTPKMEGIEGVASGAAIVFPDITELVPLPFKFDWRVTTPKSNAEIIFRNR